MPEGAWPLVDVDLCSFSWRDKDGSHMCMKVGEHGTHVCCCGSDMTTDRREHRRD
jgi:hypothetical protein